MYKVTVILSCTDIITIEIEKIVQLPQVGDKKICPICKKKVTISNMGHVYSVDEKKTKGS